VSSSFADISRARMKNGPLVFGSGIQKSAAAVS
jgi:hypothetical protein